MKPNGFELKTIHSETTPVNIDEKSLISALNEASASVRSRDSDFYLIITDLGEALPVPVPLPVDVCGHARRPWA